MVAVKAEVAFSLADRLFNPASVAELAAAVARGWAAASGNAARLADTAAFDPRAFAERALSRFPELTLKERIDWLVDCLTEVLPASTDAAFDRALDVLMSALPPPLDPTRSDDDFGRFIDVVYGEYAARHGVTAARLDRALGFLQLSTQRFSAENAIRPFLKAFPAETMAFVRRCAEHPHYHVRRLASEGIRPLLPWTERVEVPLPDVLAVLDTLHADPTRFVTRSVANNLNDISKLEPALAVATLRRWQRLGKQDPDELAWMIRHALRTLIKQHDPAAMALLGYPQDARVEVRALDVPAQVVIGESPRFAFELESAADQRLLVHLRMWFRKANGQLAPKIYLVKNGGFRGGQVAALGKKVAFKPMTTRALYPGEHRVEVVVNGVIHAGAVFELKAA